MTNDILHGLGIVALALAPIATPFFLFGLLERFFPAGQVKSARGWIFNIKLSLLYLAVPTLIGAFIIQLVALIRRSNGGGLVNLDIDGSRSVPAAIAAILVFLLVWDFFYYWWHRAQHRSKVLWEVHKLHHLDESLNVTTQMRVHWLEEIWRIPFIFVPMALIFNLPIHAGATAFALTLWTGFIHSNLRLNLGPAGRILAGPQVHRIHHSSLSQHEDRNFAAMFPLYDVIFGTYYHPARDEYPPTGLAGEPEIQTVWQAFVLPFRGWSRLVRARSRGLNSSTR